RQTGTFSAGVLDRGEVVLDDANDVNRIAVSNAFDNGTQADGQVVFQDVDDLEVNAVSAGHSYSTPAATVFFTGASGIVTTNGDIELKTGTPSVSTGDSLTLTQQVNAGTADVRFTTVGSITQATTGVIIADELGIRQTGVFSAGTLD